MIEVAITFNSTRRLTLKPTTPKDKTLLQMAFDTAQVSSIKVLPDGTYEITLTDAETSKEA